MKRIIALLLALLLALGCVMAGAEETETPEMTPFTVVCETELDEEAAADLLPSILPKLLQGIMPNMDSATIAVAQKFLPVISNLKEAVAFDGTTLQLDIMLKDVSLATLTAKLSETGAELLCSLIPSYKLTVQAETMNKLMESMNVQGQQGVQLSIDPEALSTEMQAIVEKYQDALNAVITPGQPEMGGFEYADVKFNVMTPADVDEKALFSVIAGILKDMMSNPAFSSALSSLDQTNGNGLDMSELEAKLAELENIPEEEFPEITVYVYKVVDEAGQAADKPMLISLDVDTKDAESNIFTVNMFEAEDAMILDMYGEIIEGQFFGLTLGMETAESMVLYADLYYLNPEKPLLGETITVTPNPEVTVAFDDEGKTVVAVEDLMQGTDNQLKAELMNDFTTNGVMTLLNSAMTAMPEEVGTIMSLFMGGAAAPAVEEGEAAPAGNE
ncbi:MAG: hypothetical protein IKQ41_03605 [Clostridia bacterium]|nr:hypothetical protein [Clostridia bacterium]